MIMGEYGIDQLRKSTVKVLSSDGQSISGSGFIIRSDGYLITCHHIICGLDSLRVEYQEQPYEADWCEDLSNSEVDIAILKIAIEGAEAVPIINLRDLSTSVKIYGFPHAKKEYFPDGFDVSAQRICPSASIRTISTYRTRKISYTKPWNKLPQDKSTFLSHRFDAKVDPGTSGGPVLAEALGGVVGIVQCSKSDESYVIRWDNIKESLYRLGLEPEKNAVCQFLEDIAYTFKYIRLFHTPQPIILNEQYIPIQVTLERTYTHQVETSWSYAESEAELKRAYALKGQEESKREKVDWETAKKQHQQIMVLADPGMGKSTLLRMEARITAQTESQRMLETQKTVDDVIFPLFLRLFELEERKEEIIDAISGLVKRDYPKTFSGIKHLLTEKLKQGKCLLLLDALDEVPKEQRNQLAEKLNRFTRNYTCLIICTSRIAGYGGTFVDGIKEVEIVPFSQKKTQQYIETWFINTAAHISADSVSAKALIRELQHKPQICGLAQNPLLLSLLCSLYQETGLTLPARRAQVYQKAVDYMLSKWSRNRQPQSEGQIRAKIRLLEKLAYQLTCQGQEIFSIDDLYDQIEAHLQSSQVSTIFRNINSDDLITELSEEDGILQKLTREGDQYLFLHRTFQEYLTAAYLNRSVKADPENGIELVKGYFWDYDWHEILSLLAGLMTNPLPLLQTILNEKDDIFSTLLVLAGRCLAECPKNHHALSGVIIDNILSIWLFYPSLGYIKSVFVALGRAHLQMSESLQTALIHEDICVTDEASEALGQISSPLAVEPLISLLKEIDFDIRLVAARALGQIGSPLAVEPLILALNDQSMAVRWNAAEALGQIGSPLAVEPLILALNDQSMAVRRRVAEALGRIGSPLAVEPLILALNDMDSGVRSKVAEALGRIGSSDILATLIRSPEIDIYDTDIFGLARTLAVRYSKEGVSFIPVYPELVRQGAT